MTLKKIKDTSSFLLQSLCIISKLNLGQYWRFFVPGDLEVWQMTLKINRAPLLYYCKLFVSFSGHICDFKLEFHSGNAQLRPNWRRFEPCDLESWRMTLKNKGVPLLCYFKRFASLHSHWWIQTRVTVRRRSIRVQIGNCRVWRMTSTNNRAHLLCHCKLCASLRSHVWIQTGVTVAKRSNWGKFCFRRSPVNSPYKGQWRGALMFSFICAWI